MREMFFDWLALKLLNTSEEIIARSALIHDNEQPHIRGWDM